MEVPSFSLKALGRFDSRLVIPNDTCTTNRVVDQYEFDIFLTDQPGVCYVDDVAYSLTAGTVIFARPGQTRRSILPFQCNYIYIKTQDPSLVRMLNALPNCLYTEDVDGLVEMFQDPDVISDRRTPNRYITQLRIKAAKAALAYSDTPLAQIAVDCGFSSQPYFTVRFQKETGITPLQYRKQMQARVKP